MKETASMPDVQASGGVLIRPTRWFVPLDLREMWRFRELAFFFLWRDIKGRYRQMAFGPLWMIVDPVISMVLMTIVFGRIAKLPSDGVPYPLFNFSALLPWSFFAGCVFSSSGSLQGQVGLISKVYFPRLLTPLIGIVSGLFNFLISFVILLGMCVAWGYYPHWRILTLPLFLFMAALIGLAFGLWFAGPVVHFRDTNKILGYFMKAWMYASPVVYSRSLIPERWQWAYDLNPMTHVINGFRWALLGVGSFPGWQMLWIFLALLPFLIGGAYLFRRTERNIVDVA